MTDETDLASNAGASEVVSTEAPAAVDTGPKSIRDSIAAAMEKVTAGGTENPVQTAADRARDEAGRFAKAQEQAAVADKAKVTQTDPQVQQPGTVGPEAPARFSPAAKAAWSQAPAEVKVEVDRAIRELTGGLEKYKGDAEAFGSIRQYHEMAQKSGRGLDAVLNDFVSTENMLRQDPVRGVIELCTKHLGINPQELGKALLGQSGNVSQSAERELIGKLEAKIASLEQGYGTVNQTLQQQKEAEAVREIEAFAKDKPYFEDLADQIAALMTDGLEDDGTVYKAKTLNSAYRIASENAHRFNPAVFAKMQAEKGAAPVAQKPSTDQTRPKTSISITGSPSGSNPSTRKSGASLRDSLSDAFAATGIT